MYKIFIRRGWSHRIASIYTGLTDPRHIPQIHG